MCVNKAGKKGQTSKTQNQTRRELIKQIKNGSKGNLKGAVKLHTIDGKVCLKGRFKLHTPQIWGLWMKVQRKSQRFI